MSRPSVIKGSAEIKVWDYISELKVTNELLFKGNNANELKEREGVNSGQAYVALRHFEELGLLSRHKHRHGEGITLTFADLTHYVPPAAKKRDSKKIPTTSVEMPKIGKSTEVTTIQLRVESEIAELEKSIAEKRMFLNTLTKYMEAK